MIFASKAFLIFLPLVLLAYHLTPNRTRKYALLLAASWAFYAWISPRYLWVILLLTLIDYVVALRIEAAATDRGRRRWLVLSVVSNLGLLAAFKYTTFAYDNAAAVGRLFGADVPDRTWDILLPLGISFHTFQGISYTVDVYRRQIPAVRSLLDYSLFVAFFPQLAAGPIVRAVEFLPQMASPPRVTADQVSDGVQLFVRGLFKKLFIADQLDLLIVTPVFGDPDAFGAAAHRWAAVAWAVQIYCDFSGYSDMAVGCAKWFGFELPTNFNLPYLATSIPDFWRRWHLSFSTWLRDYLYFPLGGSRLGEPRTHANLLFVFVLCGLWHGAAWNWLAYGFFYGVLMCLHRVYDRLLTGVPWADAVRASAGWAAVAWAVTMFQHLVGLILVRMESWAGGWAMAKSMVGLGDGGGSADVSIWVPVLIVTGMAGHIAGLPQPRLSAVAVPESVRAAACAAAVVLIVTLGPGVAKTFIYIQF